MKLKKVSLVVLGAAGLATLLFVACGGGDDATAVPTSPAAVTSPPAATSAPATATSPAPATAPPAATSPPASTTPPSGDLVTVGQELFMAAPANAAPQALWCSTCHQIEGVASGLIGPDLTHIGTDAATRKPGTSAEAYMREAVADPTAFVASGVDRATPGLMTDAIVEGLTADQVDALVAFLLAQG